MKAKRASDETLLLSYVLDEEILSVMSAYTPQIRLNYWGIFGEKK